MRAVTYVSNNTVEVQDKPIPEIGSDEVLLKVGGAGLCHSDVSIITMGDDSPLIGSTLGHEVSGIVESFGEDVHGWEPGDAAIVSLILSCGECRACLSGRDNECHVAYPRDALAPLSPGIGSPGGMAEYIAVKSRHLDPLGDLDPVTSAPLADAGLTPMHNINSVRDRLAADATVVLIGLGGLGHLALQILRATTGSRIIALDTDQGKLDYASSHGADIVLPSDAEAAEAILDLTSGRGADVVLDVVGVQPTVDLSTSVVAGGGAIRFIGLGGGSFPYAAQSTEILPWGVDIQRAYGGTRSDMREVIALARDGKIGVEVKKYPLDNAVQAFEDLEAGKIPARAVLVP